MLLLNLIVVASIIPSGNNKMRRYWGTDFALLVCQETNLGVLQAYLPT